MFDNNLLSKKVGQKYINDLSKNMKYKKIPTRLGKDQTLSTPIAIVCEFNIKKFSIMSRTFYKI